MRSEAAVHRRSTPLVIVEFDVEVDRVDHDQVRPRSGLRPCTDAPAARPVPACPARWRRGAERFIAALLVRSDTHKLDLEAGPSGP